MGTEPAARHGATVVLDLPLTPYPYQVSPLMGAPWRPVPGLFLHIPPTPLPGLRARAQVLAAQFTAFGLRTRISSENTLSGYQAVVTLSPTVQRRWEEFARPLRGRASKPEGYRVTVTGEGALLQANGEQGLYYAGQTLRQMLRCGSDLPSVAIEDAPLVSFRGVHWDMRGWPPTRDGLARIIEEVSSYKLNLLVLEFERHFVYGSQPGLASQEALTPEAMTDLVLFARDRGVTLVPLLSCVDHVEHILRREPYRGLREHPDCLQQLCLSQDATLEVYSAMAEELLSAHPASFFHIGGAPSPLWVLCAACKARAQALGGSTGLLMEHLGQVARYLVSRHRHVLLWDEAVRERDPQALRGLPPETVLVCRPFTVKDERVDPQVLLALEGYRKQGRSVWAGFIASKGRKFEAFEQADAAGWAAEQGLVDGLLASVVTREYGGGSLLPLSELAWPAVLYAAERAWGGQRNAPRAAFLPRAAACLFGLAQRKDQERAWNALELLLHDSPREARERLQALPREKDQPVYLRELLDAWCAIGTFQHYMSRFEETITSNYAQFQAGTADPLNSGRLRWRIENLKAHVPELSACFRKRAAPHLAAACVQEYLDNVLGYGLSRIDSWGDLLAGYPFPDKEWRSPVRI